MIVPIRDLNPGLIFNNSYILSVRDKHYTNIDYSCSFLSLNNIIKIGDYRVYKFCRQFFYIF